MKEIGDCPQILTNGDYFYRGWIHDFPTTPREVLAHLRARGAFCDICTASYIGDLDRVRELLETDPSLANRPSDYITYYACSGTPLRNAAAAGHLEIVKLLLDRGADPNLPEDGIAPRGHALYSAVYNGHYVVAKLLLASGAYPNVEVESSADTLSIAILRDNRRMIDLLCSHGAARKVELLAYYNDLQTAAAVFAANPALADDTEALVCAASEQFVRLLLRYNPELPGRVTVAKSRETTELLFRHGMDPNRADWMRIAPLHRFAAAGDLENAAMFLDHGADLNARDEDLRSTPLGYAARAGKRRMVAFLLGRGAKTRLPDDRSWATPHAWATRRGHAAILQMLERFEESGDLPPRPGPEHYESLACDLVSAWSAGDSAAADRLVEYFEIEVPAWKTGGSQLEALRRHVRERLGPPPDPKSGDKPLSLGGARRLVALWEGCGDWESLAR